MLEGNAILDVGSDEMTPLLGHEPTHNPANRIDEDGPSIMEIE